MNMKHVLFCLGSDHEMEELYNFICTLPKYGHLITVVVDGIKKPIFQNPQIRVFSEKEFFSEKIYENTIHLLVVGNQSSVGKTLIEDRMDVDITVLYQGRYHKASEWTAIHTRLTYVWGYDEESLNDWDESEHMPWIRDGKQDDSDFQRMITDML